MKTSRFTASALCIAVVGAALALAVPGSASAAGDTSPAGISFSPDHGAWTDSGAVMTTDFSCLPGTADDVPHMSGFISAVGAESPEVSAEGNLLDSFVYLFTKNSPDGSYFITDVPTNVDGTLKDDLILDQFMTGAWSDSGLVTRPNLSDQLTPNSTYSFGVFCYSSVTFGYQRDTDGRVHSAWVPLHISADGSWSFIDSGTPAEPVDTAIDLTAGLNADQKMIDLTAAVRAIDGTSPLSDATGTVTFREAGIVVGTPATVSSGIATTSITGLAAGDHRFTATYTPDAAGSTKYNESAPSSESPVVTIPEGEGDPVVPGSELNPGDTVAAGSQYKVTLAAGSFTAGDSVSASITPDSLSLTEKATVAADGSVVYGFTAPASLKAGAHSLVLSDAHGASVTVAFTVADGPAPTPTPTATTPAPAGTTPAAAANQAVKFATDWIGGMASTPLGAATLFGSLLLAAVAAVGGWIVFWRRRSAGASTGR